MALLACPMLAPTLLLAIPAFASAASSFSTSLPLAPPGGTAVVAHTVQKQGESRRHVTALRIHDVPLIDGVLEPEIWSRAPSIGSLTQREPVEGAKPSFETDIRVAYDADTLYFGMRFYDPEPDRLITTTRDFDAFLSADDRVELVLDTFHDKRNAYFFQINPTGSKGDALISGNGSNFNKPWDGIWDAIATIDDKGWVAEFAIPFKTLAFDAGSTTWGFNVERYIGRKRESSQWSGTSNNQRLFQVVHAGELRGLRGIQQGRGLDIIPFFVGTWQRDFDEPDTDRLGQTGADAFLRLTPNLSLGMTLNTDFAETEVDSRRINLTRFPLRFPERRDFFLQDAGRFSFESAGVEPFFSRRIGLGPNREVVHLLAGTKLTGRAGKVGIGILGVQTKETDDLDSKGLLAARFTMDVGEQSTVGMILTSGDPTGDANNVVAGVDAKFRTSEFQGDSNLEGTLFALHVDADGPSGEDAAFGAGINYPNDEWRWYLNAREVQENFDPALGFVQRRGIRSYNSGITWQPRINTEIRQLEIGIYSFTVTDTKDELESNTVEIQPIGFFFESGDSARIELEQTREVLTEDFAIRDDITIPMGEHDFSRWRLEFESSSTRDLGMSTTIEGGDFFDGERRDYELDLSWRSGALFRCSVGVERNELRLENGDFNTNLASASTRFSFTPEVGWNTIVQWDSDSDSFGLNSRVRWIPKPGQEVFVVFNEVLESGPNDRYSPDIQSLAFKVAYTLRF
ncbi:MAG: hypothetical protein ACI841_000237 [Planctomycetota bacterium]|jgi:hypothetical protein